MKEFPLNEEELKLLQETTCEKCLESLKKEMPFKDQLMFEEWLSKVCDGCLMRMERKLYAMIELCTTGNGGMSGTTRRH